MAAVLMTAACARPVSQFETEVGTFSDSTRFCMTTLSIELPTGNSQAETLVRDSLVACVAKELVGLGSFENPEQIPAYSGDMSDVRGCADYYGSKLASAMNEFAESDESFYPWENNISISMTGKSDKYVVFNCMNYVYLGGAHGGVTGAGPLTFDRRTGKKIEKFIVDSALMPLQDEIKKGLMSYFSEEENLATVEDMMELLFIEDGIIPFPAYQPEPGDDGLTFTYQQYEIAPYACGMPSFCIPYDVLAPYMTDEAKEILSIK